MISKQHQTKTINAIIKLIFSYIFGDTPSATCHCSSIITKKSNYFMEIINNQLLIIVALIYYF